jgi:HEAT repeat protein
MRKLSLVVPWLLAGFVFARPAQDAPPYYDPDRSLKQQEAAKDEAKAKVEAGARSAEVLAYFTDNSALVRDEVFKLLARASDAELLAELAPHVGHRDPFVSATVAELLGACRFADGRKHLEKRGLGSRDEQTALESIWALEAIGAAESADALAKAFKKRKEYRVKGDALIALSRIAPERAAELVEDALEHKVPPVRIAGLVALRQIDMTRAVTAAVAVVAADELSKRERAWEPRLLFAALETLYLWRERAGAKDLATQAIDACIARLAREEGLPQHKLGLALGDLTGEEGIQDDAGMWRGWWEARRESFAPADKEPEDDPVEEPGLPSGVAPAGPRRPVTGDDSGRKTRVRFHGIPVYSKRLVFAQDISGGMNNPLDKDEADSPTKMKFSKDELERVLGALADDVGTNIVFFATEYYRPAEQLVPLKRNRGKLIEFVRQQETPNWRKEELKHASRSNLYDALEFMLRDPQIDTVFFLSEGGPNEGRFTNHDRFMAHLARLNVYQRVEVHTLQVTTSKTLSKFLRRLARLTGGQFYDLDFLKKAGN